MSADRDLVDWVEGSQPWQNQRRSERAMTVGRAVLAVAAAGVAVTALAAMPALALAIKPFVGERSPRTVSNTVRRLERRGYLKRLPIKGGTKFTVTPTGRRFVDLETLKDLRLAIPPAQWDGQWRLVVFDVPEHQRYLRNVFRKKLRDLGFRYAQRSVWLYPFPCENELTELAQRLNIVDHVLIVVAASISSETRYLRYFHLTPS